MAIVLVNATVVEYLGGSTVGTTHTIYGLDLSDATMTTRAVTPAKLFYDLQLGSSKVADKQSEANHIALVRAARLTLQHLRQVLIAGGKSNSYTIGKLTVSKPEILSTLLQSIKDLQEEEDQFWSLLQGPGTVMDQEDLVIDNPIADPYDESRSQVLLDTPGYGGFM